MSSSLFQQLPEDIYLLVEEFLTLAFYKEWKCTCKSFNQQCCFQSILIPLKSVATSKFINNDNSFRDHLLQNLSQLERPRLFVSCAIHLLERLLEIPIVYKSIAINYYVIIRPPVLNGLESIEVRHYCSFSDSKYNNFSLRCSGDRYQHNRSVGEQQVELFELLKLPPVLSPARFYIRKMSFSYSTALKDDNLHLFQFLFELTLKYCTLVTDVSALSKVRRLVLDTCDNIRDVNCLHSIERLALTNCSKITNVNKLGHLKVLSIRNCANLKTLQGLTHNLKLQIENCPNIQDVPVIFQQRITRINLGNIPTISQVQKVSSTARELVFFSCVNLTAFCLTPYSTHLREVELAHCSMISDLSNLSFLHSLVIDNCDKIEEVARLGNVHKLTINNCNKLASIAGLGGPSQKYVNIHNCPLLTDFSPLKRVHHVHLGNCQGFTNATDVQFVEDLMLIKCSEVVDISMLGQSHMKKFTLCQCDKVTSLQGLSHIEAVHLIRNAMLKDISGLGHNQKIVISLPTQIENSQVLDEHYLVYKTSKSLLYLCRKD